MNFKNIIPGNNIPDDINVIIEISLNSSFVKYEVNNNYNLIFVDRFIKTPLLYPCNYGYINNTLSEDNDNIDVLVFCDYSLLPGVIINSRPIGVLKMVDDSGIDNKILSVPNYNITNKYDDIQDIYDLSDKYLNKIYYFFEHYKDLDNDKWTKIDGWYDVNEAKKIILNSYKKFIKLDK